MPPVPPASHKQQQPPPQPHPPAPHPPAPQPNVAALATAGQQQGSLLAEAVQGQSQQLAAQQRLLHDVVKGLLCVSARATGSSAPAAPPPQRGSAAGTAAAACPPGSPTASAAMASPARRRAALAQGLAAKLHHGPAEAAGASSDSEGEGGMPAEAAQNPSTTLPPRGMLRVPLLHARGALGGIGHRGADAICPGASPPPAAPSPPQAQAQPGRCNKPAWDDRFAAPAGAKGRGVARQSDMQPAPARRQPGGLAPALLLQELQRLQRRRFSAGDGTRDRARRSLQAPLQQANRPLDVAAGGQAGPPTRLQAAKQVIASARPLRDAAASIMALASEDPEPIPAGIPAVGTAVREQRQVAATGRRPPVAARAEGERACSPAKAAADSCPAAPGPASLDSLLEPGADQAPAQLSDSDIDAMCERLCWELLLREAAPCSPAIPLI